MTYYTTSLNSDLCKTTDRGDDYHHTFRAGYNTAVKRAKALGVNVTLYEVTDYDGDLAFKKAWDITTSNNTIG